MARRDTTQRKILVTVLAWVVGLMVFFPILWTVLTSFKTEGDAINILGFFSTGWTTEAYSVVQSRSNYVQFAMNSIFLALGSTFFALVIAIPSAWAMAFAPGKRTKDFLMWMLSTKMMPPVGALIPIYLIFRDLGLLDTRGGIITVLMLLNLPIIIWMLYTYFKEIPVRFLKPRAWMALRWARSRSMCSPPWPSPALPQPCCSTSSLPGTRPSGRSP